MAVSQGETYPDTLARSRGKTLYRYNIHEIEVTDEIGGEPRTAYEWDEVWISGKVTKAKVLEAIRLADLETADDEDAASEYVAANDKLSQIADMTYAELETYISNNVTDLASAKGFLDKLASVVLAILKRLSL
jgi:hypothetical protein